MLKLILATVVIFLAGGCSCVSDQNSKEPVIHIDLDKEQAFEGQHMIPIQSLEVLLSKINSNRKVLITEGGSITHTTVGEYKDITLGLEGVLTRWVNSAEKISPPKKEPMRQPIATRVPRLEEYEEKKKKCCKKNRNTFRFR